MDLITVDTSSEELEKESAKRLQLLTSAYSSADKEALINYTPRNPDTSKGNLFATGAKKEIKKHMKRKPKLTEPQRASVFYQTYILVLRLALNTFRDRTLMISKLLEPILMGICVAFIFFQLGTSLVEIEASIAAIYCVVSLQPYLVLLGIIIQCEFLCSGDVRLT